MDKETIKQVLDKAKKYCECVMCDCCKYSTYDEGCVFARISRVPMLWDTDKIAEVLSDDKS